MPGPSKEEGLGVLAPGSRLDGGVGGGPDKANNFGA